MRISLLKHFILFIKHLFQKKNFLYSLEKVMENFNFDQLL